jgi:hypothetical protein
MSLMSSQAPNRQYSLRPADERYASLGAMIAAAEADKNHSAERNYNAKDLQVVADNDGGLMLASPKGPAIMSHWAFGQLCRTVGAPAGYLRELPTTIAADALNYGLSDVAAGTSLVLLAQAPNGKPFPQVRACTSDSYARVWDVDLYSRIAAVMRVDDEPNADGWQLPMTWEGTRAGAYRGDRDSFLVLVNGGSIVTDPSARQGEGTMYRGLLVRNSEVGAAGVTLEQILLRAICGNHLLWGAVMDKAFRRRHVGSKVLTDVVREIHDVAFRWTSASSARDQAIIDGLIKYELAHTKEAVLDELKAIGATKEQALEMYTACEQHENVSPRSFWGLAQGLTRVSQETLYQDERYQLDRLAIEIMKRGAARVAA